MRVFGLGCLCTALALASPLLGCKGGGATSSDAAALDVVGDKPGAAGTGGGVGQSGGGGSGGAVSGGGGGASGQVDCFPACIVRLRQACEKPRVDAGTCMVGPGGYCYSNGVREILSFPDGGAQLNIDTLPDGQTLCYQVTSEPGTVLHFQTVAGQDVAVATGLGGGRYSVTCDGMTQVVDTTDPACATLNITNCVEGNCP